MKRAFVLLTLVACTKPPTPTPAPAASTALVVPTIDAGAAPPPAKPIEASLESKESKQVAKTLARVSQLRGIKATKAVPGVKLERDQLVGRIKEKALREFPPEALKREGDLLKLFGFAPPTFDYLTEMLKLLDSQLEGFYEPSNGTMYLAADLKGQEAKVTLAHELVHALQDQRWDLKPRSTYRPGEGDKTLALACLAEGDATSLMIDYDMVDKGGTALDLPDGMLRGSMAAGMATAAIKDVPNILKSSLIAPYIDGLMFVHAARRKGGWETVNAVWDTPPTTSEQVLHFEKWEKHEPALTVSTPTAVALGTGWTRDDEDTFGELDFALTFEEWVDGPEARKAAAGWGGDRSAIWVKGDEMAAAVHERFDAGKSKAEDLTKLFNGVKKKLAQKPVIATADALCFERPDLGPLLFERKDRELVITLGPARRGTTWTSTGTCATAKKWADEVIANP